MGGRFARPATYAFEVDPEFSGTGSDAARVAIGNGPRVAFILQITGTDGEPWAVEIRSGGLRIPGEAIEATPNPSLLCVQSDGVAYLIDTESRSLLRQLDPVTQIYAAFEADLLLIAGFDDLVAIGTDGERWRSGRLCMGNLSVLDATAEEIRCEGSMEGNLVPPPYTPFVVPVATGESTFVDPFATHRRQRTRRIGLWRFREKSR